MRLTRKTTGLINEIVSEPNETIENLRPLSFKITERLHKNHLLFSISVQMLYCFPFLTKETGPLYRTFLTICLNNHMVEECHQGLGITF
jgi:hypothetical protein